MSAFPCPAAGLLSSGTWLAVVSMYYSPRLGIKMSPGYRRAVSQMGSLGLFLQEQAWFAVSQYRFHCIMYFSG